MRDTRFGPAPPLRLPRRGAPIRRLVFSDTSLYAVDIWRRGQLDGSQPAQEEGSHRLARAQAGAAFRWWATMSAAERAATIARLQETPTAKAARAEVKRKAKKTPPAGAGGDAT